jgi:hypothetical protein
MSISSYLYIKASGHGVRVPIGENVGMASCQRNIEKQGEIDSQATGTAVRVTWVREWMITDK